MTVVDDGACDTPADCAWLLATFWLVIWVEGAPETDPPVGYTTIWLDCWLAVTTFIPLVGFPARVLRGLAGDVS